MAGAKLHRERWRHEAVGGVGALGTTACVSTAYWRFKAAIGDAGRHGRVDAGWPMTAHFIQRVEAGLSCCVFGQEFQAIECGDANS